MAFGTELLSKVAKNKTRKPTSLESIYYLFWDKGISLNEFNELPIPYIFSILKTYNYVKELEKKEMKKAKRKK